MDLQRILRLGVELDNYTSEIVDLSALPSTRIEKIQSDALMVKESFDLILSSRTDHIIEDQVGFKELFAHEKCYLIVEGLRSIIDVLGYQSAIIVLIDDLADDAHYLVHFKANGFDWFIDAYGLFTSLDTIKARYKNTNIVDSKTCDPNDESFIFYEKYKSHHCDLYDLIEVAAKESHNIDSMEVIMDYHELFLYQSGFFVISQLLLKAA